MKKIITYLFISGFALCGCKGQNKPENIPIEKKQLIDFETKQKNALIGKKNEVTPNLSALNFRFAAKKATPGVVHIQSTFSMKINREVPDIFKDFFDNDFWGRHFSPDERPKNQKQIGSASGVIVSNDGYIVTNDHVINDAEKIEVVLHDERKYTAKLIGADPTTDLALIKIDEKNLNFIEFGNSDSLAVGDFVLAVGNPFNLASTVTAGIVSAKARNINILTDRLAVEAFIQTDAAVNQGNSGGALVDLNGKLVGINSAIATPTGVYAGYSFAVPIEIVKKTINDLLQYGKALRGYLGITISNMNGDIAKNLGIKTTTGVVVDSLQKNGAAMKAGIQRKDVIIKIDNHKIETVPQLREIVARHRPGEKLQLLIIRDGMEKTIPVTLMPAQDGESQKSSISSDVLKVLGIQIENLTVKEKASLKIDGGVKIVKITKGKIESFTEIKEGFVVTKVNEKPIKNIDEFVNETENKKGGIMLEGFYPGNPTVYYYAFGL